MEESLKRKKGSGGVRKIKKETDVVLKRVVSEKPRITAKEIKKLHPDLLKDVAVRTIQNHLNKNLNLPSMHAAKKPLLTAAMKTKRLAFCKKYKDWRPDEWDKVMFSDESMFKCIDGGSARVRRPRGSDRYDPKFTVKTVKHPDQQMIWGCFSGAGGRGGLYFLPKNTTMNGTRYREVLEEHLLPFKDIHGFEIFMHDGAPCHKTLAVKSFLQENDIDILEWPGNSPDLNPIENVWGFMKRKLRSMDTSSVPRMVKVIKDVWLRELDPEYFRKLSHSMPKRIAEVLQKKGALLKY